MKFNIFYSWQSDLPSNENRYLIEKALKKTIKDIKQDEFDLELNIDRDTLGKSGTIDINKVIFDKILRSQIFIGDVSIINNETKQRKTPNPNVLIELGFAANKLTWNNIICVFNKKYGEVEDLPFDLKFRRISSFNNKEQLTGILKKAIKSIVDDYKNINTIYFGRVSEKLEINNDVANYIEIIKDLKGKRIKNNDKVNTIIKIEENKTNQPYIYFASPHRLGKATPEMNGIAAVFKKIAEKILIEEAPFNNIEYDLYRSVNGLNGELEIHIKHYDNE